MHKIPLTSSEALELSDYLTRPTMRQMPTAQIYWHAHSDYARRCAVALTGNDLEGALRCARISTHALALYRRETDRSRLPGRVSSAPF